MRDFHVVPRRIRFRRAQCWWCTYGWWSVPAAFFAGVLVAALI